MSPLLQERKISPFLKTTLVRATYVRQGEDIYYELGNHDVGQLAKRAGFTGRDDEGEITSYVQFRQRKRNLRDARLDFISEDYFTRTAEAARTIRLARKQLRGIVKVTGPDFVTKTLRQKRPQGK